MCCKSCHSQRCIHFCVTIQLSATSVLCYKSVSVFLAWPIQNQFKRRYIYTHLLSLYVIAQWNKSQGRSFLSRTWTEVSCHLINHTDPGKDTTLTSARDHELGSRNPGKTMTPQLTLKLNRQWLLMAYPLQMLLIVLHKLSICFYG